MKREIIKTDDGSTSLYVPELNEQYHSTHGAIQESMHVFIEAGLKQIQSNSIKIFEMGLGTGLNCLLTYLKTKDQMVEYHALEKYPIEMEMVDKLNFSDELKLAGEEGYIFKRIHALGWNTEKFLSEKFVLKKVEGDIKSYEPGGGFDLIYFDAFAPDIQVDLWSIEVFEKMYASLKDGGILTTYCAKGQVRRNMLGCGFNVERLPGPPGKREILRAVK